MNGFMDYNFNVEKIVLACHVPAGAGSTAHKDRPSHGIALHTGGMKIYDFSNGQKLIVKTNDIIYLPKNSTYTVTAESHGDCYAINFDISENVEFEPFVVNAKHHNTIRGFFHTAKKVWEQRMHGFETKCKAELYNIIYAIQQESVSEYFPQSKLNIIAPAIDYIHLNYMNGNISIDLLADMCGITPEYFRKIFKSFYSTSPVNYINNLKITRAKELLESGMYSVTDAANLSGFNEICYFSREFKKITGISPLKYKKNAQC